MYILIGSTYHIVKKSKILIIGAACFNFSSIGATMVKMFEKGKLQPCFQHQKWAIR
jgi:hypothetical protein